MLQIAISSICNLENFMFKRILKGILCLMMAATCFSSNVFATNETSALSLIKQRYVATNSYYEYIPQDLIQFNLIDDNEVLDIFMGIKVSKKLLNEDYVLDISKVTEDDLCIDNEIEPYYFVPNIGADGGAAYEVTNRIPSGYDSVTVTKKVTAQNDPSQYTYIINLYLSNAALIYFIEECLINNPVADTIASFMGEFVLTTFVLEPLEGAFLSVAIFASDICSQIINNSFYNSLVNLRRDDNGEGMAHVRLTNVSKSATDWDGQYYGWENKTRNGLIIESEVIAYKDN